MPVNPRWSEGDLPSDQVVSWRRLISEQNGIVRIDQLRAYGHSWGDVEANVRADRWRRVLPRVYATFTGDLNRRARISAALLYGGGYAVLSHDTAAEEWGILSIKERSVDITVPYTSSAVSQLPLVRVHRSRALRHTMLRTSPPRTRLTDTIVDLAVSQRTDREAMYLVIDMVSRTRVSLPAMLGCVRARPPRRHRHAITSALELVRGGLMSALEVEYATNVEQGHGLPEGERQVPFVVDGKTLWEDVTYDSYGVALTVRLDGRRYHATAGVAFRDMRRDNAAELAGRSRLIYGWQNVHENPCAVATEVRAVLTRGGWQPGPGDRAECARCAAVS